MRVFIYSAGQDTGGQGSRLKDAFDRFEPSVTARAMARHTSYLKFPVDLEFDRDVRDEAIANADVLHLMNTLPHSRHWTGPPIVLHHHGTRFRTGHAVLARQARSMGAIQLVSTVDLALLEPDTSWLPSPFDLTVLAGLRSLGNHPIRIAHAPTNRSVKGTEMVISAVKELMPRYSIEFDLIEGVSWSECLRRKGQADIFVDQLILGYGGNAVEAWAMGQPVVAGVVDPNVRAAMVERWGGLPFLEATPATLTDRLEELIVDQSLRDHWAQLGLAFVRRYHDHRVVAHQLAAVYESMEQVQEATI